MNTSSRYRGIVAFMIVIATTLVAGDTIAQRSAPTPAPVRTPNPAPAPAPAGEEKPSDVVNGETVKLGKIDFVNASINAVLEYYARLTKRTLIPAPNLAGQITFRAQTELTVEEAIQAMDSVLALNGITTVPIGDKFLKVVQIAMGKAEVPPVNVGREGIPARDMLITQIIPLKYVDTTEAVQAVQPYLHPYGQIIPLVKSNSLMITDTAHNISQKLAIIAYVDQPTALRIDRRVYQIRYARAADIVSQLRTIIQETQQAAGTTPGAPRPPMPVRVPVPGQPPQPAPVTAPIGEVQQESIVEGKVIMTADDRTNKIFILSRPENFEFFDDIIEELDMQVDPDVVIEVVPLDFANAEEIAGLLNSVVTGSAPPSTARQPQTSSTQRQSRFASSRQRQTAQRTTTTPAAPTPATPAVAAAGALEGFLEYPEGVRIIPDQRTNSLMIVATRKDMQRLRELIRTIDTVVPQVLVEVIIAEVNLDQGLELGVEMVKRMFTEGQVTQTGATSTGRPPKPADLGSLSGELFQSALSNAAPIALSSLSGGLTYFATFNNLKLDAVLRALATSSNFKVLSTPIIQTMNNQEARITVGESRPVPTEAVSDITGSSTTAVRQNIEFRDIAIELTVTPRINPDGYVSMDINQTINDVGGNIPLNGTLVPIITLREAKSSVSVKNQSTIVLGGLIKENKTDSETKVPLLGDIPFLGNLFKGKSTSTTRNELIVFIKPTVLRSDREATDEASRRAKLLKAGKEFDLQKRFDNPTDTQPAPEVVPELTPVPDADTPMWRMEAPAPAP